MTRLLFMALIQLFFSMLIIGGVLMLMVVMVWAHDAPDHKWLQKMHHPISDLDCCEPEGDCRRITVPARLEGEEWVVQFHGTEYRWPVEETTMGLDEHFWICFNIHHPDGPSDNFRNLNRNRPRCLITPAIG